MKVTFENRRDADIFLDKLADLLVAMKNEKSSFHVRVALYRFLLNLDMCVKEEEGGVKCLN